jgi:hypothetical protein
MLQWMTTGLNQQVAEYNSPAAQARRAAAAPAPARAAQLDQHRSQRPVPGDSAPHGTDTQAHARTRSYSASPASPASPASGAAGA